MHRHHDKLAGLRILVVEDELVVAMEIEDMLQDLRCELAGPVSTVAEAMAAVERDDGFDGVLLDLNLGGETALPVAEALVDKGVSFILVTGYASRQSDPPALRDARRLNKPFNRQRLSEAMAEAFIH